ESTFLGLFIFGEKRLGPKLHWLSAVATWLGSWLSGFFIIATDAWMQHPVGHHVTADGHIVLDSLLQLITNPWILWQYTHNMLATVVTGSFVVAALGSFYVLTGRSVEYGKTFVRVGVIAGLISVALVAFPTGDGQSLNVAKYQPATIAAMEGLFKTTDAAPLALVGQPDVDKGTIDNPIEVPHALGLLTTRNWSGKVKGLDEI